MAGDITRFRRAPLITGAALVLLLGAASVLYVLLGPASKPSYARFAHGGLAHLHVLVDPPAQPTQLLLDLDHHPHHLSDFRGHIVVVNLWATWCPPCVEELPTLGALQRRYAGRVAVITVSADSESDRERAQSELSRLSGGALNFMQEPSRAILFSAGADVMPTTILYDAQGQELARVSGKADWSSAEADGFIDAALARR